MPTAYENGIFGMIPEKDWLDVGTEVKRQEDPIDGLFGDKKTDNLIAEYHTIAAENQIPVMAQFHAFDTETLETFREPINTHSIEKGLIKTKIPQSERLRTLIDRMGVKETELYDWVIRDGARLAEEVITRTKVAKNELMATGKVTIKENNLDITVDYGVDATQTVFTLDLATTSDLGSQIQTIIDAALAKGVTITGMITSRQNISKMRRNAGLQKNIYGNVSVGSIIKSSDLETFLSEEFGINTIITNDLTYRIPDGKNADGTPKTKIVRYFPDNKVTFFATNSNGQMGIGLWGNPPEATTSVDTNATASSISPYVYITQWAENDPKVTWTKASALFIPVLYAPDSLYIATTTDSTPTGA